MSLSKNPKVILFDIGGVCVVSPFQAILDYELSLGVPPGWVNYSISKTAPNGFWHRLERGEIPMDIKFFKGFRDDLHNAERWRDFYATQLAKNPRLARDDSNGKTPPIPNLDAEWLFHDMMRASADPDPWMFPALKNLKASGHYIIAALSNTVIFPDGHELAPVANGFLDHPVRSLFDVFVSSAHVGLRKPDPRIYHLALEKVDAYARSRADTTRGKVLGWGDGVKADEVVFLDDIGENLKTGRKEGFGTVKVSLGRTYEAVDELEQITGLALAGNHPRIPIKPRLKKKDGEAAVTVTTKSKI